jgi:hypothetical protein
MSFYYLSRSGPNRWRDSRKPSQILADVCKLRGLNFVTPRPGETTLVVDKTLFSLDKFGNCEKFLKGCKAKNFLTSVFVLEKRMKPNPHLGRKDERLCLHVLKEFNLVPENVETRKLYNPIQPGVEQVI